MELLSDEEFLPHDMLPKDVIPTEEEKRKIAESVFLLPYDETKTKVITVSVDDE